MHRKIDKIIEQLIYSNPWNKKLGLARSFLAASTLLTLVFNHSNTLFTYGTGITTVPICDGLAKFGIFCLFSDNLELARYLSIAILAITILGYLPRYTCVLSWWVAFSYFNSSVNVDGGDQVNAVLSLLLIPICLGDSRRNHWVDRDYVYPQSGLAKFSVLCASITLIVIQVQVAIIYFVSAIAKLYVTEWLNGTVLHYWMNNPLIGGNNFVLPVVSYFFKWDLLLFIVSWGVLVTELLLFIRLFQPGKNNATLLFLGILFHAGTAVLFGIISFCFSMIAALILFLVVNRYKQPTVVSA